MRRRSLFAIALAAVALSACGTNPVTGKREIQFVSEAQELQIGEQQYAPTRQSEGGDLTVAPELTAYVSEIGQKLAAVADRKLPYEFSVLNSSVPNAWALPGGKIAVNRGLLTELKSEAELAAVLGHEIGHVTARHSVRQQSQNLLTGILATGAAIFTGNRAVADLANIGGQALLKGYGRDMELEADRLGATYLAKTGYDTQAMIGVISVLKNQETWEIQRAREEGREPRVYHGVFASHPSADDRLQQAVAVAKPAKAGATPRVGVEDYMGHLQGVSFMSSKQQGIIRDNRFYHAGLGITIAFPKEWIVLNQRNRLLAHTRTQDAILQITTDARPDNTTPREYLQKHLGDRSLTAGQELNFNEMEGYSLIARSGSPLDGGRGPVRYAAVYRGKLVFIFAASSRSSQDSVPAHDRVFLSTFTTLRSLKPSEFPLAEPYRIDLVKAQTGTKMEELAKDSPIKKYPVQTLRLINDLYPNKDPQPGRIVKVVD
jgi:predicted Zn-dependent protease